MLRSQVELQHLLVHVSACLCKLRMELRVQYSLV